ncbi:hypothetical protein BGZ65_007533 [Modicella reniformis]|uniref:Uncharacterized protein n=1 Tax=Modicella reniformis TaxID=1440133 RepID=A0A9P6JHD2_9FUNG|nr:hypothetical protein BGZ65_007533 [Modicella reniformis]
MSAVATKTAGTVRAAASKVTTSTPSSKTVYLFRHIQTSQVLVTLKNTVEKQSLKQITKETRRPPHVRPDHWQPLVPQRLRAVQEMNQLDETLVKMVELLNEQPQIKAAKGKGIHILWEREGVKHQLLQKEGVSFLDGIQHGDLAIRRGRDIVNA